ncbi:RCC1 domain-containing protein [Clostridium hydrogenum]|uniref:RCC1 domain-containing protein n=1 Tax=Clostridium hydrogenum TaxID=2855764 RepID=UPI001F4172B7|nr:hypothetical protein [Clostridium hydrogenum]
MNKWNLSKKVISICLSLFIAAGGITGFVLYKARAEAGDTKTKYDNTAPSASFNISKKKKVDVEVLTGNDNNYVQSDLQNKVQLELTNQLTNSGVDAQVTTKGIDAADNNSTANAISSVNWRENSNHFIVNLTDSMFSYTPSKPTIKQVYAGKDEFFVLLTDGSLYAVGNNDEGRLGNGTTNDITSWQKVMDDVSQVSLSNWATFIVKKDGTLWAAGFDEWGQFGDNRSSGYNVNTWKKVLTNVSQVSTTPYTTLVTKTDGTVWEAGRDIYGNFGDGRTYDNTDDDHMQLTWKKVFDNAAQVLSAGSGFTSFVVKNDSTLWATGYNGGIFGNGQTDNTSTWIQIANNVKHVESNGDVSFIIKNDNSLWETGNNYNNLLGLPNNVTSIKTWTKALDNVINVTVGSYSSMVLKSDGTLYGTGANWYGDMGSDRVQPTTWTQLLTNAASMNTSGYVTTLVLKKDGSLCYTGAPTVGPYYKEVIPGEYNWTDYPSPDVPTPTPIKNKLSAQEVAYLENLNMYFVGATTANVEDEVSDLINKLDGRGTYVENTSLATSLEKSENYIMSILNQQQDNSNIFLIGDEVDYKENYKDSDANDPKNDELWSYIQDNKHLNYDNDFVKCSQTGDLPLDNDLGMASFATGQWMHDKVTVFNKPGKYKVSLKVQDNPTATDSNPSGDSNFNDYDKWSTDDNSVIINVNRKPIALFTAYATANSSTGQYDITESDGSDSYDPDHQITDGTRKGIVNKDFQWKEISDGVADTWHEGKLPTTEAANKDFLVKLQVEDLEGEMSDPMVKLVSTRNENLPPIAQFTENETTMAVDQLQNDAAPSGDYVNDRSDVIFTDNSYDPNGDSIEEKWTVVDSNGNTIYTGSTMPNANTFYGKSLGTYTISLVCDDGPTPKVGVPFTSEPYTQQLTLVPINHMPVAHFEVDNTSKEPENIKITEDSTDPDGDPIADRIWTVRDGSGNVVEQTENQIPDLSTLDGTYTLTLKVKDNPKIPPELWSKPYSKQITVESLKLVGTLYPNPAEQGQQITFDLTTTGYAKYLRIYLPNDITSRDTKGTTYPIEKTITEENIHNEKINYILPINTPVTLDSNGARVRPPYEIPVQAEKENGAMKAINLYLDVKGNVLDGIKTEIIGTGQDRNN